MSEFFQQLEEQRRIECEKIGCGALAGVLVGVLAVKFMTAPANILELWPAIGGSLPGACIVAGILERREEQHIKSLHQI